jgi:hypothetical protein
LRSWLTLQLWIEGIIFLVNVSKLLPDCTMFHPRRRYSS